MTQKQMCGVEMAMNISNPVACSSGASGSPSDEFAIPDQIIVNPSSGRAAIDESAKLCVEVRN
jgi:hypothetical protein